MFRNLIVEQNPHWGGKRYQAGVIRNCFEKLLSFLKAPMVVSVLGVRRSGKSTLLKQLINTLIFEENVNPKNIFFLNLEHPSLIAHAGNGEALQKIYEEYLELAKPEGEVYCFLDEVQFFKDWPIFVKAHYEQKGVKFVVTGSNSSLLSSDMMTMLSGRTLTLEVFPLSFRELAKARGIPTEDHLARTQRRHELRNLFEEYLHYGGFPGVVLDQPSEIALEMLSAYAKTILYQDVIPRLQLRKTEEIEKFYTYLISNVGKLFSYRQLSSLFALSDKSAKEYLGAFEESYLLFEVDLFDYSMKKQIRNPKKIYSIDTGQVHAIAFQFTKNAGRLFENAVFLDLKRIGLDVYYYKTKEGAEIDFLVKKGENMALVQVSWALSSSETEERELRPLPVGASTLGLKRSLLITLGHENEFIVEGHTIQVVTAVEYFCLTQEQKLSLLFS